MGRGVQSEIQVLLIHAYGVKATNRRGSIACAPAPVLLFTAKKSGGLFDNLQKLLSVFVKFCVPDSGNERHLH